MLWKILSGIAAVLLAVGVYSSFFLDWDAKKGEAEKVKNARSYVEMVKAKINEVKGVHDERQKNIAEQKTKLQDATNELTKANDELSKAQQEVAELTKKKADVEQEVAKIEDSIRKAGDIQTLQAEVAGLDKDSKEAEAALANQMQQSSITEEKIAAAKKSIDALRLEEKREKAGVVAPGFTARVRQTVPFMGFVVLDKGMANGMFVRANLDVKHGNKVVAKLKVRDVETRSAIADLIPGSMPDGNSIHAGDLVVASADQPKVEESSSAPSTAGGAPAAGAAATGPLPASTPGAPATPTTPLVPAAADPFGGPAPAAGGAPASGGGTPQNPSTADPFAPAGAAPATPGAATPNDPFAPK